VTYVTTVLADNPRHYWRMADPGGFLLHDIGALASVTMESAQSGSCLPYTGVASEGGSCAVPTSGGPITVAFLNLASPMSIEIWEYNIVDFVGRYIASFDGVGANTFGISTDAAGHSACSANGTNLISATIGTVELWHHYVQTYDGVSQRLYYDGALIAGPQAVAGPIAANRQLRFGGNAAGAGVVYGAVAEGATYNYALTAAQVATHYAAADLRLQPPIFKGAIGLLDVLTLATVDLATLASYISHTYQNAP
jgi:hypothetical protein